MSDIPTFAVLPVPYAEFLRDLKHDIRTARVKAALAVNSALVQLYWRIGTRILDQQAKEGWGTKVINAISEDLRREFPEMKGFGRANIHNMRKFAEIYPDFDFVQQVAGQIPWFHHVVLIEKVKNREERIWYIHQTIENGWSRNVLLHQIGLNLYHRQGKALTNFKHCLPSPQSDLAQQLIKNDYNLEFLNVHDTIQERNLEEALVNNIREFLLELGSGFAFVGNQYHRELEGEDYYLDLLFYHIRLRCYVVIELKTGKFKPEYAGKLNFYLNLVDGKLKHADDNPTIGLVLCRDHSAITAEYSLKDIGKPMGVSAYQLMGALPAGFKEVLPSAEDLEAGIRSRLPAAAA